MRERLAGKRIMVVGAGSGIGAATAMRLAREGAIVAVGDIDLPAAVRVASLLGSVGAEGTAVEIDIADPVSVAAGFARAVDDLGGLDGVHVNAADLRVIFSDTDALDFDLDVFDRTIDVNLRGHLLCTRAALPHLLAAGGGALLFTSSAAAQSGEPTRPAYAMSKSGLHALMRHVASRWGGDNIRANCVAPGFVMTPEMIRGGEVPDQLIETFLAATPSSRIGKVEDIAGVAAMLLSDDGEWINGQVVHVNGGALMQ